MPLFKIIPLSRHSAEPCNPFDYLLDKKRSIKPEVLRGCPMETWATIQSFRSKNPYSSFILNNGFDNVSPRILEEMMDYLECLIFAGEDKSNFRFCWVLHRDKKKPNSTSSSPISTLALRSSSSPTFISGIVSFLKRLLH